MPLSDIQLTFAMHLNTHDSPLSRKGDAEKQFSGSGFTLITDRSFNTPHTRPVVQ